MIPTNAELDTIWLRRLLGVALLGLVAASWPLWAGHPDFPQIPWLAASVPIPQWVDVGLTAVLIGVIAALVVPVRHAGVDRAAWFALSGLLLLDQHRCQPWAYQFWLLLAVLSLADAATALRCARALTVGIYVWSAVSKLDPGFVESHGQMLLDGWLRCLGVDGRALSDVTRERIAWLMPLGELLTAGLLAWPQGWRVGLPLSILLHVGLLMAVGPWGLDHELGVVLWNVYFIAQNVLLFRNPQQSPALGEQPGRWARRGTRVALAVVTAAMALPLLNPLGLWDHWPSLSVYSAHPAFVRLYVDETTVDRLPLSLQPWVLPPEPLQTWRQIALDQWSFQELHVPPYPQERWKLSLAAAVAEQADLQEHVRVDVLWRPHWWCVEREQTQWIGTDALQERLQASWVNTADR